MSFLLRLCEDLVAHPERVLLIENRSGGRRSVSAGALLSRCAAFRQALRARGVAAEDRVMLVAANSIDWIALDLAVLSEGAVLVPLDPRQAPAELATLIRDADPKLLVWGSLPEGVELSSVEHCLLPELISDGEVDWPALQPPAKESLATILYTSGSSGEAKGALLSHGNLDFMLERTAERLAELTGLPAGQDRALHYLPLCYAGSRILLLSCLLRGACLELVDQPKRLGEVLPVVEPHYFLNVPLVLERFKRAALSAVEAKGRILLRLFKEGMAAWERDQEGRASFRDRWVLALARGLLFRRIRARFGARLRGVICGSAPLAPETQSFFHMLGVLIYQGYGLTETTALCTLDVEGAIRPGWVGPALPQVELKTSPEGEILARGPHLFSGYWRRPEASRAALDSEGWFRTGDLGEEDQQGRWRITGRRSAVLVLRSGHNVGPEALESALREDLPDCASVIVLGQGRPHLVALLAGEAGERLEEAAVEAALERLNARVGPAKQIRRHLILDEPFSSENGLLTSNMKMRRQTIAERFAAQVETLYSRDTVRT